METHHDEPREAVSFRFNMTTKSQLHQLAKSTGQTRTAIAKEAIAMFCDLHNWQIEAVKVGIEAADKGDVIPHANIRAKQERMDSGSF